jgi:RNA-dependent RNA polymerase
MNANFSATVQAAGLITVTFSFVYGLLNTHTHDLLVTLQEPIEDAIERYGDASSEFVFFSSEALKTRKADKDPRDCLGRMQSDMRHTKLPSSNSSHTKISCEISRVTTSSSLPRGYFSKDLIRRSQTVSSATIKITHLLLLNSSSAWSSVMKTIFHAAGMATSMGRGSSNGVLGPSCAVGSNSVGREFEFLAYSTSALSEHSVWFVSPFRDPVKGYVTAERIRSSLGDFSELLRTPSKYAARIVLAFTVTNRSIKIRRDQWSEQPDLGPYTDSVGIGHPSEGHLVALSHDRHNFLGLHDHPC